jgi:hypothetical protein
MRLSALFKSWRIAGNRVLAEFMGGVAVNGAKWDPVVTLTYGPSIALDASLGTRFVVTVTDAVAFTVAAPTNPPATGFGQLLILTIRNASGGAHGAGTFNAVFKTAGAVPAIANGSSRSFVFAWDGTNWVEIVRGAADVAN